MTSEKEQKEQKEQKEHKGSLQAGIVVEWLDGTRETLTQTWMGTEVLEVNGMQYPLRRMKSILIEHIKGDAHETT